MRSLSPDRAAIPRAMPCGISLGPAGPSLHCTYTTMFLPVCQPLPRQVAQCGRPRCVVEEHAARKLCLSCLSEPLAPRKSRTYTEIAMIARIACVEKLRTRH
jgi:hypothetical protein